MKYGQTSYPPSMMFPTGYDAIIDRINQVDPVAYGRTRNFTDGDVTYLSPFISRGVISVRQVQDAILAKGYPAKAIEKFLQELAWREYFQRVWQARSDVLFEDLKQPQAGVIHHQMIEGIVHATTAIHAIDDAIKEFYNTGYLHNHVRMYVASLACNMGKAHWLMPSRWMYAHLLDGDVASNTCSWQWVAGAFANKKYYCSQENINRYTKYDQRGTFLDLATELLPGAPVPPALKRTSPWELQTQLPSTQKLDIDGTIPTLLYNSYNLDPLWRKMERVNRVLLLEPSHFRKFPASNKVIDFIISLAKNIPGIQVMTGEVADLLAVHGNPRAGNNAFISKEHPAFTHYPGVKDERDWIYPHVTGYYPSFFSFWKQCQRNNELNVGEVR